MPPALARIVPPEQPLPPVRLIRTVVRNPIEPWPQPVYEQPVFRSRAFGRETVFITEPDLIQEILVSQAGAFRKAESLRRALRPALGDAILTAEGGRWRWQRRATAPIFRHERIRSFVPVMIAAAERTRDKWLAHPAGTEIPWRVRPRQFDRQLWSEWRRRDIRNRLQRFRWLE
jgi:cytochrome P450